MKSRWMIIGAVAGVTALASYAVVKTTRAPLIRQVQAQTPALNIGRAAYAVSTESYEHASGSQMLYLTFDGVQFTEAAEPPLDRAHQVCHATCRVQTLGAQCMGYCSAVDDDGDVAWVSWDRVDGTGGTWKYIGGTGKYEGEDGGGTWTVGGEHGPNIVSNFWARTY